MASVRPVSADETVPVSSTFEPVSFVLFELPQPEEIAKQRAEPLTIAER